MSCDWPALALAGVIVASSCASAQEQVSPETLYDCTTLTDPAQLQQCVVTGQGAPKIRGRLSSHREPAPDAPIFKDAQSPDKTLVPLSGAP